MGKQDLTTVSTDVNGHDRDPNGRFVSGNQAAAGRSTRSAEARKALENAVTARDVADLGKALLTQAKLGDAVAARTLLDRLVPKLSVETEVRERLAAWKTAFLDELLYAVNTQSLRERLTGGRCSPGEEQAAILELLENLDAFQAAA
ncbi:MAG: hypothetical protein KF777_00205 [Planctomycetaceae bacterium]|nr:hypothetical protein [Planctomycetaceae bacterium]